MTPVTAERFPSLDGWRGIAILCVLAGHLLPLGPKNWQMNAAVATTGMVIFFNLSGFLITSILLRNPNVTQFLIRRFMRIAPLAWLVLLITLVWLRAPLESFAPHLLFYANWGHPMPLVNETSHFWSLCVEMQFYLGIACLTLILRRYFVYAIPLICLAVTALRWHDGAAVSIQTWYRVDEILAGCLLAVLYARPLRVSSWFARLHPAVLLPLVVLSSHPKAGCILYFRPYLSMLLLGSTLCGAARHPWTNRVLASSVLRYFATVSYALYVFHGGLSYTWLGEGDKLVVYLKRPLLLGVTFVLAHFSTLYYEKYWIRLGKKISVRMPLRVPTHADA